MMVDIMERHEFALEQFGYAHTPNPHLSDEDSKIISRYLNLLQSSYMYVCNLLEGERALQFDTQSKYQFCTTVLAISFFRFPFLQDVILQSLQDSIETTDAPHKLLLKDLQNDPETTHIFTNHPIQNNLSITFGDNGVASSRYSIVGDNGFANFGKSYHNNNNNNNVYQSEGNSNRSILKPQSTISTNTLSTHVLSDLKCVPEVSETDMVENSDNDSKNKKKTSIVPYSGKTSQIQINAKCMTPTKRHSIVQEDLTDPIDESERPLQIHNNNIPPLLQHNNNNNNDCRSLSSEGIVPPISFPDMDRSDTPRSIEYKSLNTGRRREPPKVTVKSIPNDEVSKHLRIDYNTMDKNDENPLTIQPMTPLTPSDKSVTMIGNIFKFGTCSIEPEIQTELSEKLKANREVKEVKLEEILRERRLSRASRSATSVDELYDDNNNKYIMEHPSLYKWDLFMKPYQVLLNKPLPYLHLLNTDGEFYSHFLLSYHNHIYNITRGDCNWSIISGYNDILIPFPILIIALARQVRLMNLERQERKRGPKRHLVLPDTNRARGSVLSCIKAVLYNKNMFNICIKLIMETMNSNDAKNVNLIFDWIEEWINLVLREYNGTYYTDEGVRTESIIIIIYK